ncbi:MAG: fructose-bisphosphatase class III [Lachnospiraceae bacterium]|nr:fructose-bisphosphatase class III [Lachnospiraceae bacterium]
MTYVISDIHGNFDKYEGMLKLIQLSDEDELYVIGDVIDRGLDGVKILRDIMERPNVHMLLGNHELMAVEAILATDGLSRWKKMDLWMWNSGAATYNALMALNVEERDRMVAFLVNLPVSMEIRVNGQNFHLVHGFPADGEKDQVWARPDLDTPNPFTDSTLVIGHTPVVLLHGDTDEEINSYIDGLDRVGEHFKIEHAGGFIDIDCGCGSGIPEARLACLRLDDMEEFYI